MADPQDITRQPDDSLVPLTWAEGGIATEPSAGRKDTGTLAGDALAAAELNWLSQEPMRWLRALWSRYVDGSDLLFSSWLTRNGVWSSTGVPAFDGFLSDVAGIDSKVADVWIDPASIDTGGVQVQVQVAKASPHTFTASKDTYVFVPVSSIAPPTITEPELTFLEVNVGDPAPATPAGTVGVWRVETDGVGIVDQEILVPTIPIMRALGILALSVAGDLEINGNLSVDGNTTLGDASGDTVTVLAGTITQPGVFTGSSIAGEFTITTPLVANGTATFNGVTTFFDPVTISNDVTVSIGVSITGGSGTTLEMEALRATGLSRADRLLLDAGGSPTANGQLFRDANGYLKQQVAGDDLFYHASEHGYLRASGTEEAATTLAATVDVQTTGTIALLNTASTLWAVAHVHAQRVGGGGADFTIEHSTDALSWTPIGAARTLNLKSTGDATDWSYISFKRDHAPGDTTARYYRIFIDGNGANVRVRDSFIEAYPDR